MARKTRIQYRDTETGEFIRKDEALGRPKNEYIRENVPVKGRGDVDKTRRSSRKR